MPSSVHAPEALNLAFLVLIEESLQPMRDRNRDSVTYPVAHNGEEFEVCVSRKRTLNPGPDSILVGSVDWVGTYECGDRIGPYRYGSELRLKPICPQHPGKKLLLIENSQETLECKIHGTVSAAYAMRRPTELFCPQCFAETTAESLEG